MTKRHCLSKEARFPLERETTLENGISEGGEIYSRILPLTFHSKISDDGPSAVTPLPPPLPPGGINDYCTGNAELPANNKQRSQPLGVDHVHRGKHTLRTHSGPLHGTTPRLINFLCNLTTRAAARTTKIMQRPIETFSAFSSLHRTRYFCLPSILFSLPFSNSPSTRLVRTKQQSSSLPRVFLRDAKFREISIRESFRRDSSYVCVRQHDRAAFSRVRPLPTEVGFAAAVSRC